MDSKKTCVKCQVVEEDMGLCLVPFALQHRGDSVLCCLPRESSRVRSQSGGNSWTRKCELWAHYISSHSPREARRSWLIAIALLPSAHLLCRRLFSQLTMSMRRKRQRKVGKETAMCWAPYHCFFFALCISLDSMSLVFPFTVRVIELDSS